MHSCGSFHTGCTNKNSHRRTKSAQPYGQIMSIMRNTSGGTKSVGGRKTGSGDAMRQKGKRRKNKIAKLDWEAKMHMSEVKREVLTQTANEYKPNK